MIALYRSLLRLYPYDYRAAFAAEMLKTFKAGEEGGRSAAKELFAVLIGAGSEWMAKLTTDKGVRGRALPDMRMMRPAGVTREQWFSSRCSPGI